MSNEPFAELDLLDRKIDALIGEYKNIREESDALRKEREQKDNRISELESNNSDLQQQMESLRGGTDEQKKKLETAAQKIQAIMSKLESIG